MTSATQSQDTAVNAVAVSAGAGAGDEQAAREAYAAFELLVSSSCFAREPILHREAAAKREQARTILTQALARLETVQ